VRSGICESCGTLGTVEGKGSLQSFHIPRANDMQGSRQELDDNEQHIQSRTKQERRGRAWYGRAPGAARSGGVPVTNVEGVRALQSLLSATRLQEESAKTAPPFFPNAGRGTVRFLGKEQGPTVFSWDGLGEEGREG